MVTLVKVFLFLSLRSCVEYSIEVMYGSHYINEGRSSGQIGSELELGG